VVVHHVAFIDLGCVELAPPVLGGLEIGKAVPATSTDTLQTHASRPLAAAAASRTAVFCWCAAASHREMAPFRRNLKNASPSTSALGSSESANAAATLDLPAPGGPVTTITSPTAKILG
jgi:hypothetical protein